jgi:membrane protease YdiL (CAAX protease family)
MSEQDEERTEISERPEGIEEQFPNQPDNVTYSDDELKNKWFGVPPKGEIPVYNKWKYVIMLILVIIVEIGIWAGYRYITGVVLELQFGDHLFYALHIVAAPTIHLLPIILFWRFVRKERGLPFVFSKKLLLSGILIGFLAAIIWRLLEEFTYWSFASAAGGTNGPLTFLNFLETADLFIIMTFVMYFIVGPVEELEFRGFVQDQGARALSNYQAVILSSVLFGCSHIPIAVFIYKLPPAAFADALFGWIAAGFTFGFLYMWSRNIFACIVMHGMGNWQLSVFYFQALPGNMEPTTAMIVGMATSLVSNAIMIYIFYLIHKHYWEPHRRGEPAFGGRFMDLQKFMYDHDFDRKPLRSTIIVFVAFIFVVSAIIAGSAYGLGTPWMDFYGTPDAVEDDVGVSNFETTNVTETYSSTVDENSQDDFQFEIAEDNYRLLWINATLTWQDESSGFFGGTNDPDNFKISIINPNGDTIAESSMENSGSISLNAPIDHTVENFKEENTGTWILVIEAGECGDDFSRFGFRTIQDSGNTVSLDIQYTFLQPV